MNSLRNNLAEIGVQDFIDLQSFLWKIISLEEKMNPDVSQNFPIVRVWVLRVKPAQIRDEVPLSLTIDLTDSEHLLSFYRKCVETGFQIGDIVIFLEKGGASQVLAEGRISEFRVEQDQLELQASDLIRNEVQLSAKTNHQVIVPGLFNNLGPNVVGAAQLCREYFDKTRATYLLTYNPERRRTGGVGAQDGRLSFQVSDKTNWNCHTIPRSRQNPKFIVGYEAEIV